MGGPDGKKETEDEDVLAELVGEEEPDDTDDAEEGTTFGSRASRCPPDTMTRASRCPPDTILREDT